MKVSVIVPVYNPGSHIDDCLRSLLSQSLGTGDYEAIFVDDGSTDGTGERLDALAAEHEHVRVEHIPNSGWPGRPRNVGLDMARGDFVFFADNDDWLEPDALEHLHGRALATGADVVVGKVVGHGRKIPRPLFGANRDDAGLGWPPLLTLLTPHKLFRRSLLSEHGIRFPEGRRRLEDHPFVVHAYLHARRVAILADRPIYHWAFRDAGRNASAARVDPAGYYANLREVLDLVEEHMPPGPERDRVLVHWYRGKLLRRVGGERFLVAHAEDERHNRLLHREVRALARERYGERFHQYLSFALRLRSRLLLDGDYEDLLALARDQAAVRLDARVLRARLDGAAADLELEVRPRGSGASGSYSQSGERSEWVPPPALRGRFAPEDLDVTGALRASRVRLVARSRADRSEYLVPAGTRLELAGRRPVLAARARLDATRAAAGRPLPAGVWELHANAVLPGAGADAPLEGPRGTPACVRWDGSASLRLVRTPLGARVRLRFPGLVRRLRRLRR